jgi:hypothetical protein
MHETSAEIERRSAAGAPPTPGKLRLVGLNDLDGRFGSTKRARALADALRGELGGKLLASQFVAVERAATLIAIAEDARARRIAGDLTISLEDLVRIDNAASRALRALGIKPDAPAPHVPLREQLAAEAAARGGRNG